MIRRSWRKAAALTLAAFAVLAANGGGDATFDTILGDRWRNSELAPVRPASDATLPLSTDFGDVSVPMSAVKAIEFPKG